MWQRWIMAVFGTALVAMALGLWWRWGPDQAARVLGPSEAVRVAVVSSPVAAPVWIATAQGFFRDAGVEVTVLEFETGPAALAGMLRGEADVAMSSDTACVLHWLAGRDFALVATFARSASVSHIITRAGTGIAAAADLRGKRVGTVTGTSAHFSLYTALLREGLALEDVHVNEGKPDALPEMLRQGQVDAVVIWEPFASRAKAGLQGSAMILPASGLYSSTVNLVARTGFAGQHPAAVQRLVQGLEAAIQFIHQHPAEAYALMAQRSRPDAPLTEAGWQEYTFGLQLDQSLLPSLENIARWAIRQRFTEVTTVPNFLETIDFQALDAVKPEAISIIR
jgi:NitT/TauT family transport system substrate-binding protein